MEAWYMNETDEDQRLPHHCNPQRFVSVEKLSELGVLYWHLDDVDKVDTNEELQQIRKSRGYTYSAVITCAPDKLPNYDENLKRFFQEHIHADDETHLVLEGSGYFDTRDEGDQWIRIWVKQGDLIGLPAGIYHRFTADSSNYIKTLSMFVGEPTVLTTYNRPQDDNPIRKGYLDNLFKKEESSSALQAH